jgi:EmrB/QacA subfamily drug resistance transporter
VITSRDRPEPNRWAILTLLGTAQLMVVLDATIVNVALPSAQRSLDFSAEYRQWVVTAYALALGSLLLVGGKLGDLFGRKWTFIAGLVGFAMASAVGGVAQSFGVLVAARALQGVCAAVLAPSALGLLTITFAGSPDRPKAFGIFSALAGSGAAVGLLLGGILTEALSWRWCLYVNLFLALPVAAVAFRLLVNQPHPSRPRIDVLGMVLATAGLFGVVFGFSNAETDAWGAPLTIASLGGAVVLLAAFAAVQRRVAAPLLPPHILADRARSGAYAGIAIAGSGGFAVFLFLTFYLQQTLGLSALETGVAFLPMTTAILITSIVVQTRLLGRYPARRIVATGMALGAVGMVSLTRVTADSAYVTHVLPGLVVIGAAMGAVVATAYGTATLNVSGEEAGVASAMINTSQQVGGSVGTALLSTLFAGAVSSYAAAHAGAADLAQDANVHGYQVAFWWAAGIFALGMLVALAVLPSRPVLATGEPELALALE